MFAIVGLGNPGRRYHGTRHNLGFDVVDQLVADAERICREFGVEPAAGMAPVSGGPISWQSKFGCEFARGSVGSVECLFVKPQQFMNCSGQAAGPLLGYFRVPLERIVVVYDELDLPAGQVRLKFGGSAAGHRGLADMVRNLGSDKFHRIRVGIGRRADGGGEDAGRGDASSWVLGKPGPEEKELLDKAVHIAAGAAAVLIHRGLSTAQQQFHTAGPVSGATLDTTSGTKETRSK